MKVDLLSAIRSLLQNTLSVQEETHLAHHAHRFATLLITKFHAKHLRNFRDAKYDVASLGWRCIEDLFIPRNGVKCWELFTYFSHRWKNDASIPTEEIEIALRRLVSKKTSQTIPEVYGELDAEYRKALRNVTRCVKRSSGYRVRNAVFGLLVFRCPEEQARLEMPEIPIEELTQLFFQRSLPAMETQTLVETMFDVLAEQTSYRQTLPLSLIVSLIRDFRASFSDEDASQFDEPFDHELEDVESLVHKTNRFLTEGIFTKYIERKITTETETIALGRAVNSALSDLLDGGMKPLAEYHKEQFSNISYSEYRKFHRNRFEYVIALAKEHFIGECKKKLGLP